MASRSVTVSLVTLLQAPPAAQTTAAPGTGTGQASPYTAAKGYSSSAASSSSGQQQYAGASGSQSTPQIHSAVPRRILDCLTWASCAHATSDNYFRFAFAPGEGGQGARAFLWHYFMLDREEPNSRHGCRCWRHAGIVSSAIAMLARCTEEPLWCTYRCTEHAVDGCHCPGTCKQVAGSLDISSGHRQWCKPAGLVPAQVEPRSTRPTAGTCPGNVHSSGNVCRALQHILHGSEVVACDARCAFLPIGVVRLAAAGPRP